MSEWEEIRFAIKLGLGMLLFLVLIGLVRV